MGNVYFITVLIFAQALVFVKAGQASAQSPNATTASDSTSVSTLAIFPWPCYCPCHCPCYYNKYCTPISATPSTISSSQSCNCSCYNCNSTSTTPTVSSSTSTSTSTSAPFTITPPVGDPTTSIVSSSVPLASPAGSLTSSTPTSTPASLTSSTPTSTPASLTSSTPTSTSASARPSTFTSTSAGSTPSSTPTSTSASTTPSPTTAGPPSSSMVQSTPAGRPEITTQPQNTTTAEGSNVSLSCNVSGDPVLTISWTKDGSTLSVSGNSRINFGGDNKTLTISNVNKADSGEYRCVAVNSLGDATSNPATLNVQFAPEITAHPQNATRAEGSNVTLCCNASGNPAPTFSWTKDGTVVKTTANPRITLSSQNKKLTIINVNITDNGQYRCVATNIHGNATSNAATLDVRPAPQITTHPENKTTTEGRNVTLSCNASGNPEPTFSWTKDGSTLSASGNSRINLRGGNKTLTITNVNKADRGEYRCVAINSLGKATSYPAILNVQFAAEITTHPQDATIAEGSNVTLSCNAIGNPEPTFSWTKDESAVNTNTNPRITLSSQNKKLTITNVNRTDSGQYRCVANNAIGTSATSNAATLDVQRVTITNVVKSGECKRVCCSAGGPLKFEQQCTVGGQKCEGFVGKETEQTGHCHGGDGDACKDVQCDRGVSSHFPSFSLLILLTTASFVKLTV